MTMISLSLLSGFIIFAIVNTANGQNFGPMMEATDCFLFKDAHLVVLDLSCEEMIKVVSWFVSQGYEIKAVQQDLQNLQTLMWLQK